MHFVKYWQVVSKRGPNSRLQAICQSGAGSMYDFGFGGPLWQAPEPNR